MGFGKFAKAILFSLVAFSAQESFASAAICVAYPEVCAAPSGGSGSARESQNRIYAGLVWALGGKKTSFTPELVLGARSLTVKSNDSVSGVDFNVKIDAFRHWKIDTVKLGYIGGNRDVQANVGAGWSFDESRWLVTAAVEGPFVRAGSDYLLGDGLSGFRPFVELNSLTKPTKVNGGSSSLTCPSGSTMSSSSSVGATGSQSNGGKTCVSAFE
jgi:hypothetical protein